VAEQDDKRPGDEADEAPERQAPASEGSESEKPVSKAGAATDDDGDAGRDDAAARVAEALGVDDEGDGEAAAAPAEPAEAEEEVKNRAVRRREEAIERRRKKKPGDKAGARSRDELPKDRNARAKELLQRRREDAASGRRGSDLGAGEMVDDVLARVTTNATEWLKEHAGVVLGVVLVAILGGVGYAGYSAFSDRKAIAASRVLADGLSAEGGRVMAEDKRSDEEKEADSSRVFKTTKEREDAALNAYNQVVDQYAGTGPAILAKLGQAGVYLQKREWDHAIDAFGAVVSSKLAAADVDVKGRAIEGIGLAREGKGDLDGALASFKELESVGVEGFKNLAQYHQGRVLLAKGDKDKAKDVLKALHDKLEIPNPSGPPPSPYLREMVDETLRKIDPTLAPARSTLAGPKGGQMTPEELQAMLRRAQEAAQKKAQDHE
jgi:hypothetical protein